MQSWRRDGKQLERGVDSTFFGASLPLTLGLLCGLILSMEIGFRMGRRRIAKSADGLPSGVGAADAAVYGLMGLLIAFAFSGAASRFQERRHLVTEEANAIGTAYLRLDLLAADAQPRLRQLMRDYADVRAAANEQPDGADIRLQGVIWAQAQHNCRDPGAAAAACQLLLPALNDMIDITTTRASAARDHPPSTIYVMLVLICLASAVVIGYNMAANQRRSWLHIMLMAFTLSMAVYVIVDLEFPRLGLIRIDKADWVLMEARRAMGP